MTEWYFVWVEGLRGPVPQKWSSDGLWGQVGRQDVIVRFTLDDAEAHLSLDELARRHPIPDRQIVRLGWRPPQDFHTSLWCHTWLCREHCKLNFVAGLNGRKEAPLSRVQFAGFAD